MKIFFKVVTTLALLFESSIAMYENFGLSVNPQTASICMQSLSGIKSVTMQMERTASGNLIVSMPMEIIFTLFTKEPNLESLVTNLLSDIRTERFGINPQLDFILKEDSIDHFNILFSELGSKVINILPYCSSAQIESIVTQLRLCSGTSAQTAYSACSEFSQKSESEISKIENYYNNVSEKLEILVNMIQRKNP